MRERLLTCRTHELLNFGHGGFRFTAGIAEMQRVYRFLLEARKVSLSEQVLAAARRRQRNANKRAGRST
jgi:hypothetical protein